MSERDEQRYEEGDEQQRADAMPWGEESGQYEEGQGAGAPDEPPFPPGDSEVQTRV